MSSIKLGLFLPEDESAPGTGIEVSFVEVDRHLARRWFNYLGAKGIKVRLVTTHEEVEEL